MKIAGSLIALLGTWILTFSAVACDPPNTACVPLGVCEEMQQTELGIRFCVGESVIPVQWEDNAAVDALIALLKQGTVTVNTQRYGGFEQVGPLPTSLPSNDMQLTAAPGDIVLYAGDQLVLFFGSNTWEYTRLGHLDTMTEELTALLGAENAVVTLTWMDAQEEMGV